MKSGSAAPRPGLRSTRVSRQTEITGSGGKGMPMFVRFLTSIPAPGSVFQIGQSVSRAFGRDQGRFGVCSQFLQRWRDVVNRCRCPNERVSGAWFGGSEQESSGTSARSPGKGETRRKIAVIADIILQFVTQASSERQLWMDSPIVLDKYRHLPGSHRPSDHLPLSRTGPLQCSDLLRCPTVSQPYLRATSEPPRNKHSKIQNAAGRRQMNCYVGKISRSARAPN